jgi:hypothetical protein
MSASMTRKLDELRKAPHWSFSSLNTFVNCCSLKWAFDHVYKTEKEATSASLPSDAPSTLRPAIWRSASGIASC